MKRILVILLFFLIFLLTGCTYDADPEIADKIGKQLIKENIIPKNSTIIDKQVESSCIEACFYYTYYIHKDTSGNLIAVNYQKLNKNRRELKGCDYVARVNKKIYENKVYESEITTSTDEESKKYYIPRYYDEEYCILEKDMLFYRTYIIKR